MNWSTAWLVFLGLVALGFAALEITSIAVTPHDTTENTLSATLRRWFGISPKKPRRWWIRAAFLAFLVWFVIHIYSPWL